MATGPYAPLGNVLAGNFGGDGINVFNVPDLRGRFMRGTCHGAQRDPNSSTRFRLFPGGNVGDNTGSAQYFATALPVTPYTIQSAGAHSHNLANVPQNGHHAAMGAHGIAAYWTMGWSNGATTTSASGAHTHAILGGDSETRPQNIYVNWLLTVNDFSDAPPIGSIVAFAGDMTDLGVRSAVNAAGWYACNGDKLKISDSGNQALLAAIGTLYGGDSISFNLPDLRGYFIMGAGGTRAAAAVQNTSTATLPRTTMFTTDTAADHTHTAYNVPNQTHTIVVVVGYNLAENNPSETPTSTDGAHTHALGGGDAESRPTNVYVDYIIRFQ